MPLLSPVKRGDAPRLVVSGPGSTGRDNSRVWRGRAIRLKLSSVHDRDRVDLHQTPGVGGEADDPMDLAKLLPLTLEQQAPVVIDAPFAEMPIPRAPQFAFVYNMPWTHPQEGRIDS